MMYIKKLRWMNFIIIFSMLLLMFGCGKENQGGGKELTAKDLIEPAASHDAFVKASTGDIKVAEVLDARVSPSIQYLFFDRSLLFGEYDFSLGSKVKKGDIIAKSYTLENEKTIKALKEQLQNRKDQYNYDIRSKKIQLEVKKYELQAINKNTMKEQYIAKIGEINGLELSINHDSQMEKMEESHLENQITALEGKKDSFSIKANTDGEIVGLLGLKQGDQVTSSDRVVALADRNHPLIQTTYIDQDVIKTYQRIYAVINGKEYEIKYIPYENSEYRSLIAAGETPVGNFELKVPNGQELMGSYAVIVMVKEEHKNVICLPNSAINTDSAGKYVLKIENGKRVRYDIQIGISDDVYTEIIKGVKVGEEIFTQDKDKESEASTQAIIKDEFSTDFEESAKKIWKNEKTVTFDTQGVGMVFDSYAIKENDFVKKGQPIAYILPSLDEVTLMEKKFELEAINKKLSELDDNFKMNLNQKNTQKKLSSSKNQNQIIELEIKQIKLDSQYQKSLLQSQKTKMEQEIQDIVKMSKVSKIIATKDCIITKLGDLHKGDPIHPSTMIVKMADYQDYYIAVEDSQSLLTYQQEVSVVNGEKEVKGTVVTTWDNTLVTSLQNKSTLIRVSNPNDIDRDMVTVKAKTKKMNQVYQVDRSFLFVSNRSSFVKVMDQEGNVTRKVILPGGYNDKYCWTVSGIHDDMKLMKNTD